MTRDYSQVSFWLETCGDDLTPRPSLEGSLDVDVAVLGAGYTGLWTAYYLLQHNPSLSIAIVEREIAGFGASGRNGGWVTPGFSVSHGELTRRHGADAARAVDTALRETLDEVGRVCTVEGIDAHYLKGGSLMIARGAHQVPALHEEYASYQAAGLQDRVRLLDAEETAARVRVRDARESLFTPDCARIHPGRLVRGLAHVVEARGARIYEQTEVTDFRDGPSPALMTARGEVRAQTIVLAGEAYLSRLSKLHRQLVPIYSLITLTEPLSEAQWAEIGWEGMECLDSFRYTVDYLQRTADGRILFGSRGAPYHLGSRIADEYDRHEATHAMIRDLLVDWFPALRGIRFTHAWGGVVGMPRDWMPTVSYDRATGVATARGYTGQGVATSNLTGRILADLITREDTPITHLPMVGHRSPNWEPEPLRWLAIRALQWSYGHIDQKAERTGKPPSGKTLTDRLTRH